MKPKPAKRVQTKESFEKYLAMMRKEAEKLQKPLPGEMSCPCCPKGNAILVSDTITHEVEGYKYKGEHWYYKCLSCKEEFTTNESDTISLASYAEV
jgi:hypothetical protein